MERTLDVIKKDNLKYWKVEHWNPYAKRRIDLFNIIDLLVLDGCILGIQVCGSDYQEHVRKITEDEKENTLSWLAAGGRFEIWSWRKLKKVRGGKAMEWEPRISDVLAVGGEIYIEERKK
jgi:hypothetical protein